MRRIQNVLIAGCCCLVIGAVGVYGQGDEKTEGAAPAATTAEAKESKPETVEVKKGHFHVELSLNGVFEAREMTEVVLRPKTWATFEVEKAVSPGTVVKKGDPLVWFDAKKLDEEIKNSEFAQQLGKFALRQAELDYELLKKTVQMDLDLAERSLRNAKEDWDHFLKVGESLKKRGSEESVKNSEDMLLGAREELEQLEKMYKADDLTEETEEIILKRARRDVERAEYFTEAARVGHLRNMEMEFPRERRQMEESLTRQELTTAKTKETLPLNFEKAKVDLEKEVFGQKQGGEKLADLKGDRELMVLKSPADGVVLYGQCDRGKWTTVEAMEKQLRQGGSLTANQVVMTIVPDGADLFVRVEIPEKELRFFKKGVQLTVHPAVDPSAIWKGMLMKQSRTANGSGNYDALFEFDAEHEKEVQPGMNCTVKVLAYHRTDALAIPTTAIFSEPETPTERFVYVQKGSDGHEKRIVTVGETSGDKTEILKGLSAGEKILTKKPE